MLTTLTWNTQGVSTDTANGVISFDELRSSTSHTYENVGGEGFDLRVSSNQRMVYSGGDLNYTLPGSSLSFEFFATGTSDPVAVTGFAVNWRDLDIAYGGGQTGPFTIVDASGNSHVLDSSTFSLGSALTTIDLDSGNGVSPDGVASTGNGNWGDSHLAFTTDVSTIPIQAFRLARTRDYIAPTSLGLDLEIAPPGTPEVAISEATVVEGDPGDANQLVFDVTLSHAVAADVSVDYSTQNGTASAGSDYAAASGTVTIPAGQTSAQVTVDVVGDNDFEADETVNLFVSNLDANGQDVTLAGDVVEQGGGGSPGVFIGNGQGLFGPGSSKTARGDAVALGDLDGDGDTDAFHSNGAVFTNDGSGTFTDSGQRLALSTPGSDVELADLDGDNDLDAFVTHLTADVSTVWVNDGNGTFTLHATIDHVGFHDSVSLGDIDNDNDIDAIVTTRSKGTSNVYVNDGSGNFSLHQNLVNPAPTYYGNAHDVYGMLEDLDGDGDLDLYAARGFWSDRSRFGNKTADRVWLNDGSGTFSYSGQEIGADGSFAAAAGDIDNDGDVDVVKVSIDTWSATSPRYVQINLNDGAGAFSDGGRITGFSSNTETIDLADVDGDGDLDMLLADRYDAYVYLNDGNGAFSNSGQRLRVSSAGKGLFGDLDGDGDADVFVPGSLNAVYLNQGIPAQTGVIAVGTIVDDDANAAPTADNAAFSLAENSANGTVVGTVSASDPDNDPLVYAITAGNVGGAFAIDANTGEISVASSAALDYETSPVFNLTVAVTDDDGASDSAVVTVSLTDEQYDVALTASDSTAAEPGDNGEFTVSLPVGVVAPAGGLDVSYSVSGTASSTDYAALSGTVTIPAGQSSATIAVEVIDDNVVELDETVQITATFTSDPDFVIAEDILVHYAGTASGTLPSGATFSDESVLLRVIVDTSTRADSHGRIFYQPYEWVIGGTTLSGAANDAAVIVPGDVTPHPIEGYSTTSQVPVFRGRNADGATPAWSYGRGARVEPLINITDTGSIGGKDQVVGGTLNISALTFSTFEAVSGGVVTVIISDDDFAPIASDDTNKIDELMGSVDSTSNNITGNVLQNVDHLDGFSDVADTDADDGTAGLSVAAVDGNTVIGATNVAGTYGTLTMNPDGSYTYDLDDAIALLEDLGDGQTLTESFSYTATDGSNSSNPATLTVTIQGTTDNQPPELTVQSDVVTVNEGSVATNGGSVSDPDGDAVTLSSESADILINNNDGTWSWSLPTSDNGPASGTSVTISGDDGNGGSDDVSFTLVVNNVAPTASVSGDASVLAGDSASFTLGATDVSSADQAAGFTYDIDWDGDGNVDQTVSGADGLAVSHSFATAGSASVIVTATDKDGGTSAQVSTTINVIQPIDVDVKPGNAQNNVNAKSQGVIPVAIYTTADFDATTIVGSSVQLAGINANHFALEDVDGDGDLDLILHFDTQAVKDALGVDLNSGESVSVKAELTGQTIDDVFIYGFDTIEFFQPGKGRGKK